jgi:hypothetical protein
MAKKTTVSSKTSTKTAAPAAAPVATAVRNSPVPPKTVTVAKKAAPAPTWEQIAIRAYEISRSPLAGNEQENWFRAERELRGGA